MSWLDPKSLERLSSYLSSLMKGRLWLQVFIGMILGVTTGILLGPSVHWVDPNTATLITNWLSLPGQLFLALIQMIVIPLVVASIILGIGASESFEQLRKMGLQVVGYFLATTVLAIGLGFLVAFLIQPGNWINKELVQATLATQPNTPTVENAPPLDFIESPQKIITILPDNPLSSMVEGQMFQIVLFSIIFGIALLMISKEKSKPLLDVLKAILEVCMTIVRWAMWLAPLAVFGLLTQLTSKIGLSALLGMAVYVATVLLGLLLLFLCYLILLALFAKISPFYFLKSTKEVLLLAFSTSSSAAVMPLTIKTVEQKLSVRPSVSQFVIPLGATINMNGTALYQGVATIFLAQVFGIEIGWAGLLLVVVTAVGASIGTPATPGVGIVVLAMVLESVGIPAAGIALILGVDRILDMSRTTINVCGDMVASKLTDGWNPPETSFSNKTG
ncbi:MAG: dicarboxylate/amino acid:cation symporter [bacterium]|nr:dicarboxylate/amino acid:cation symporter [bacterium]